PGMQLDDGVARRPPDDRRIPNRFRNGSRHQNTRPCSISRCSTIGPRLSAGKNVRAPTIRITLTSRPAKSGVVTGNVPGDGGTRFLRPRLPATASIGVITKKRPMSIAKPRVVLYQGVFAPRPANADPLFPVPEVNAYSICESPCGPGFVIADVP